MHNEKGMGAKPRFTIASLGCKVNRAETESLAARFEACGWEYVEASGDKAPDVAIVNTCTVTVEADAKNRKRIRSLLASGAGSVLVTGCAAAIDPDGFATLGKNVGCEPDKTRIVEAAKALLSRRENGNDAKSGDASSHTKGRGSQAQAQVQGRNTATLAQAARLQAVSRTRADVKIQDGCDNACTYCIVCKARGPARSRPPEEVVDEIGFLSQSGTREVVLVGIDLGAYASEGCDLAGLLSLIQKRTDIGRIRISSIEPQSVTSTLVEELARSDGRLCRHLHLCLQSGSDKVLSEMGRGYTAGVFIAQVKELKRRVPDIALSTDVIVGFPGETDENFADTLATVEQCGFMRLHVFRYSPRPGTAAAERNDQVPANIARMRAQKLRTLGSRLAHEDMRRRIGHVEQIIVERAGRGTGESYHTVVFEEGPALGSLVLMRYAGLDESGEALLAKPVA